MAETTAGSEQTPLLETALEVTNGNVGTSNATVHTSSSETEYVTTQAVGKVQIGRVLPLAFTVAFAIAATSATTIFAYASILCKDPAHCEHGEKQRYAGVVALATTVANVFGVIAVGFLQQWTKSHPKLGLYLWLACRATGIAFLVVAVLLRSIYVAIAGRVFEGLATDNILHYCLSAIYVRVNDQARFSQLMGTSLALYMAGMSMSPVTMTLLPNFFFSFIVAIGVLALSSVYLKGFVTIPSSDVDTNQPSPETTSPHSEGGRAFFLSPILYLLKDRHALLPGLALLLYNTTQAYLFPAIMVHAATKFAFTDTENNYIVSLAAATSSVYLFVVLYLIPKLGNVFSRTRKGNSHHNTSPLHGTYWQDGSEVTGTRFSGDLFYALLSTSTQLVVLPCFVIAGAAPMLYALVVLVALGLGAPSFIKSYAVLVGNVKESVLASMVIMESVGGLLSPIVLGMAQSLTDDGGVFIIASASVGAAVLCLIGSLLVKR
ncbi:hypothetical protein BKA67DRAFT_532652 [Truncatella angustata]|uniref:Uncharacterized protein n=1 Tax=Truncatella angustata TaxID=152316 RepID=A0A9P9A1R7_9PEZI|nr:uncharacterized protein BKA67DRAFT_532652 [Truncatella angustata]KAH6657441.1 hypothetical protein BKA67DRAFT_532652 [Truncatella angustata]